MSMGRKSRVGRVVSNKMDKTVLVEIEYRRRHPLYRKVLRMQRRFMAHDEENTCQEGDLVRIVETRPLSRHKRWRVAEIVERAL
jgi:small subunit ribosomal protein S17